MVCKEIQTLLHAYTDGELDFSTSLNVERHVDVCADCARYQKNLLSIHHGLRSPGLYHAAPQSLIARVERSLDLNAPVRKRGLPRSAIFASGFTLAGAAVLVVLLFLSHSDVFHSDVFRSDVSRLDGRNESGLKNELVASHIRSLMVNHLTDVASTDRHTVKPWFNGKIDYAPPVVDLKAEGFPLIGGRLDYLDGRAVTVLVYGRALHRINLFVWPLKESAHARNPVPLRSSTQEGYHIEYWTEGDLQYAAVSDLNSTELTTFARDIQSSHNLP